MSSVSCFAAYDPPIVKEEEPRVFEAILDYFEIAPGDRGPIVVGYSGDKTLRPNSLEDVIYDGLMTLEIGQCAETARKEIASFGLSYINKEKLNSSMLFISQANDGSTSINGAIFRLIDKFAEFGVLGYSIGFESPSEEAGFYHAAAITHGAPTTGEENLLADEYGRFFFDRVMKPVSARKFHSGMFRPFHEVNLLDQKQFDKLAADQGTHFVIDKFHKKSFSTDMHLFVADKDQLVTINAKLRKCGLLI